MFEFNTQKKNRSIKNGDKDRKALYKLMNNVVYRKLMESLRNTIDLKLVSNKKNYLKWTSKRSYMPHKIFDIDLIEIRKIKITNVYFRFK